MNQKYVWVIRRHGRDRSTQIEAATAEMAAAIFLQAQYGDQVSRERLYERDFFPGDGSNTWSVDALHPVEPRHAP